MVTHVTKRNKPRSEPYVPQGIVAYGRIDYDLWWRTRKPKLNSRHLVPYCHTICLGIVL